MREERRGREKRPHARATGSGSSAGLRRTRLARGTFVVRWGGRCLFMASPGGATDSAGDLLTRALLHRRCLETR